MPYEPGSKAEWLETDGLGGFASGTTTSGLRTRRYHALLLASLRPPAQRFVLVNGFDAWVETPGGIVPITSQRYLPGIDAPANALRHARFDSEPWPRWTFTLPDGTSLEQELFVRHEDPTVCLRWRLSRRKARSTLWVRPFLSGRDLHALHHENPAFRFAAEPWGNGLLWRPYEGVPGIGALCSGEFEPRPDWYRSFLYDEERARGLDFLEDLASPGLFRFDLAEGDAALVFTALMPEEAPEAPARGALATFDAHFTAEVKRRRAFATRLHRSAQAYLVRRGKGKTIIAGYPWFADWGRDTFIALRGLCLATRRVSEARQILLEWADALSEGMLPNRFPERGEAPEYNSVDASLWYVVAVQDFFRASKGRRPALAVADRRRLEAAVEAILEGYSRGTRFRIGKDVDGLLHCGEPGLQLTWMDAKVGDRVVTPRIGKPVEIQALWLNALAVGCPISKRWEEELQRARRSFEKRFWNEERGFLYDVVDADHVPGAVDATFRPNQIYAVGGLPLPLLAGPKARRVVDAVEAHLLTPLGLRSLAPGEPGYSSRYEGGVAERDGAFHQGTVWPYLMGPFVEAWVRVRGNGNPAAHHAEARKRFLEPLLAHLDAAGIGHLPEIADAEPPHTPRGCPFQAWSVAEALRLGEEVLLPEKTKRVRTRRRHPSTSTSPG